MPNVVETILSTSSMDADLVNQTYEKIKPEYFDDFIRNCVFLSGDKKKNEKYEKLIEKLNAFDLQFLKKINYSQIFYSALSDEYVSYVLSILDYFSSLSNEEKDKLSADYAKRILVSNYSMALSCDKSSASFQNSDLKPLNIKDKLIQELASMKNENGEWMFDNNIILKIIDTQNNFNELSKVLHLLKEEGLASDKKFVFSILASKGVTCKNIKNKLQKAKEINKDGRLDELSSFVTPSYILLLSEEQLKNFERNIPYVELIKKYFPRLYEKTLTRDCSDIFLILENAKLSPKNFEECLKFGFFSDVRSLYEVNLFLSDDKLMNIKPQNFRFLSQLKERKELGFLFNNFLGSNSDLNVLHNVLVADLDENVDLNNKNEIIKLILEDENTKRISRAYNDFCVNLLLKNTDDTYDDGKKLAEFYINNYESLGLDISFFINHSFKETLELISEYQKRPKLEKQISSLCSISYETVKKYIELVDFISDFENFDDCELYTNYIFGYWGNGESKDIDIDMLKDELKNLDLALSKMSNELKKEVKEAAFNTTMISPFCRVPQIKLENIPCLEFVLQNDYLKEKLDLSGISLYNFLTTNKLSFEEFKNKTNEMVDFFKKVSSVRNIDFALFSFVGFDCDYDLLYRKICQISKAYPNNLIYINVSNENNIEFNIGNEIKITYDKDINLLSRNRNYNVKKSDGREYKYSCMDDENSKSKAYIISLSNKYYLQSFAEKLALVFYNNEKNTVLSKIYKPSNLSGFCKIDTLNPKGKKKELAFCVETTHFAGYEKHLTSPDGIKTDVFYTKSDDGFEEFRYKITDKNSNVLCNFIRTSRIIDDNHRITTFNDKEYRISYFDDGVEIYDVKENKKYLINYDKSNLDNNDMMIDIYKMLPGDELIKMSQLVDRIKLSENNESYFDYINRDIVCESSLAILEHELGHAKKIQDITVAQLLKKTSDLKNLTQTYRTNWNNLINIYNQERKSALQNLPSTVINQINYYLGDDYADAKRINAALNEFIAETNVIQAIPIFAPINAITTQLLQEYFPRTIAYLINNFLV